MGTRVRLGRQHLKLGDALFESVSRVKSYQSLVESGLPGRLLEFRIEMGPIIDHAFGRFFARSADIVTHGRRDRVSNAYPRFDARQVHFSKIALNDGHATGSTLGKQFAEQLEPFAARTPLCCGFSIDQFQKDVVVADSGQHPPGPPERPFDRANPQPVSGHLQQVEGRLGPARRDAHLVYRVRVLRP
jgi:hypothetical protein